MARDCCRLRLSCDVSRLCLLLHLPMALFQVKHFDVRIRKDLVNSVSRRATGFPIQVVALHEDRVIGQTTEPDVACRDEEG